jgi:hypothetical protein
MRFVLPAVLVLCCGSVAASTERNGAAAEHHPATILTIRLPGGVEGIRRALGDRAPMDPALVGVDIARRLYGGADEPTRGHVLLPRLLEWLQTCARALTSANDPESCGDPSLRADAVPIPGTPAFWREFVLGDRTSDAALILRILSNRRATLLYTALLSMDEGTRRWILSSPALLRRLSEEQVGALIVTAPYLRAANGTWVLPGDEEALAAWVTVSGSSSADAASFLPAFLSAHRGLLPYLAELASTLAPEQRALAFGLNRTPGDSVSAARGLLSVTRVALAPWRAGERPFWRPSPDPALLLAQIAVSEGRMQLPAGRQFWEAALADGYVAIPEDTARALWGGAEPVEPAWLIEQVFSGSQARQSVKYEQVLFGARMFAGATEEAAGDVLIAVRAYARFPELLRTLERMQVSDPALVASVVRRAAALPNAADGWRARAAIVQWQSAVMLLLRTAERSTPGREAPAPHVLGELSRVDASSARSNATLRWLVAWLGRTTADADPANEALGTALVERLAASDAAVGRRVTWEDTQYAIDFAAAERSRFDRVRTRASRGWLDAAVAALHLADGLSDARDGRSSPADAQRVQAVDSALSRLTGEEFGDAARNAWASARRQLEQPGRRRRDQTREALQDVADAIGALALREITYAANMGWAEGLPLKADAAARRHRLTIDANAGQSSDLSWTSPRIATGEGNAWHVRGSILGLDLALAPVTLRRLSMKPPAAPPSLSDGNRQLLRTTLALLERRRFSDAGQRDVATLIARGRGRLMAATSPEQVAALAVEGGVSPLRSGLAHWSATANPALRPRLFSLSELIRLGLRGGPFPATLDGWGNSELPLSGREACGPLPPLFWERYAGRWSHGILAYAVPDLQLALASHLADMGLPAVLVPDLMAIAVHDFIYSVPARHPDDWEAMVSWVAGLTRENVERYLGRLTTDGPLRVVAGD